MQCLIDYHMQKVCQLLSIPLDSICIVTDKTTHKGHRAVVTNCQYLGWEGAYWLCPLTNKHTVYIDTTSGRVTEAVAHELRHVWQAITGSLGDYDHDHEYTTNPHEIDATQWAMGYCNGLFD